VDGTRLPPIDDEQLVLALVAHDSKKQDLVDWATFNRHILANYMLYSTENTGEALRQHADLDVALLKSGALGGDAQVGGMIAEGLIDMVVFLWDPLTPQPHDVDVKALLRLAVLYDVPIACNRRTADLLISSPVLKELESRKSPSVPPTAN
jgi:methylglyoxal synthase